MIIRAKKEIKIVNLANLVLELWLFERHKYFRISPFNSTKCPIFKAKINQNGNKWRLITIFLYNLMCLTYSYKT